MCTAIAAVMGMQIAGGVMGAASAEAAAKDKQNYYNYLAAQNEVQAGRVKAAAEEQVTAIQDVALENQIELDRQGRQLEGRQKAVLAAGGVWGNSRTAQDILKDTLTQEGRDAAALRYNADVTSYETRRTAAESARALREQATGYRMGGDMARRAGDWAAAGSIIGGATSVGNTWLNYTNARTPKG